MLTRKRKRDQDHEQDALLRAPLRRSKRARVTRLPPPKVVGRAGAPPDGKGTDTWAKPSNKKKLGQFGIGAVETAERRKPNEVKLAATTTATTRTRSQDTISPTSKRLKTKSKADPRPRTEAKPTTSRPEAKGMRKERRTKRPTTATAASKTIGRGQRPRCGICRRLGYLTVYHHREHCFNCDEPQPRGFFCDECGADASQMPSSTAVVFWRAFDACAHRWEAASDEIMHTGCCSSVCAYCGVRDGEPTGFYAMCVHDRVEDIDDDEAESDTEGESQSEADGAVDDDESEAIEDAKGVDERGQEKITGPTGHDLVDIEDGEGTSDADVN